MPRYQLRRGAQKIGRVSVEPDHDRGGKAIRDLFVEPEHRRQGHARKLLQHVKASHQEPLSIRPRPYQDMGVAIEPLKEFYRSEGFQPQDKKDNMALTKVASGHFERLAGLLFQRKGRGQ